MELGGLIPALVTPFGKKGEVNIPELRKLVRVLLEEGADGFYVTGSTGECFLLTDEERIRIVAAVAEEVNGKVPVVAHVGEIGTDRAVVLAKEAERAGVDAVSSVPPFYYDFKFEEIVNYYAAITDAVSLPMVVYNYPKFSGVTITSENLSQVMQKCRVGGLKYTDMNLYELEKIRTCYPELKVMFGRDEALLSALPLGIDGAIGSTYNVMLRKYKRLWAAYKEGKIDEAEAIQHDACRVIDRFMCIRDITAEKYLLGRVGVQAGGCRPPFKPITEKEKGFLDEIDNLD